MSDHAVFEVHVEATFEVRMRDEFGWVDGCEPGNGKYSKPETQIHWIVAPSEELAKARALYAYKFGSGAKDLEVKLVARHHLTAIIFEPRP